MRRIILVILVLGLLAQTGSAVSGVVFMHDLPGGGGPSYNDSGIISSNTYYWTCTVAWKIDSRTGNNEGSSAGCWYSTTGTNLFDSSIVLSSGGAYTNVFSGNGSVSTTKFGTMGALSGLAVGAVDVTLTYSDTPPNMASGTSCVNGTFYMYVEDSPSSDYFNFSYNSYSFQIYDGINYSVEFVPDEGETQWHFFTAFGDETWNPECVEDGYTVSGQIIGPDGEGINHAYVFLKWVQPPDPDLLVYAGSPTDSTGNYTFNNVDVGAYFIMIFVHGPSGILEYPDDWFYVINNTQVKTLVDPIPSNIRLKVLDWNSNPISGALLHMKDLPGTTSGAWMTTDSAGYTTYTPLYHSWMYFDLHSVGDGNSSSSPLYQTKSLGDAQIAYGLVTLTIPADYLTNESFNLTDPGTDPLGNETEYPDLKDNITFPCDGSFLVTVLDSLGAAIPDATVKATASNKSIKGQWIGLTNASGQFSFCRSDAVGSYDVEVKKTCYYPQSDTRSYSKSFTLNYSCTDGLPPGTDDNGSGGWQGNESYGNWSMNGTLSDESEIQKKLTSIFYYVLLGLFLVMIGSYFTKK